MNCDKDCCGEECDCGDCGRCEGIDVEMTVAAVVPSIVR